MDKIAFLKEMGAWSLMSGSRLVLVLILTFIGLKAARIFSRRLFSAIHRKKEDTEFEKRKETLALVIQHLMTTAIVVVAAIMIMGEIGVEIGPVLAAAGIVGLAVGFGAQSLVKDVISGFFILLEDQIRVGDVVQIAGHGGVVEKINLRTTILRDLSGNVHYVTNGQIDTVTNMTKEYSRYVFEIGVAYREDVDEVMEVIKEVGEDLRNDHDYNSDILEPIEILGLDQFADSAIVIKARFKTKPIQQWRVAREFNRRLKKKFDEKDIEIPFPHLTLYMGKDKDGQSPPLDLLIKEKN